MFRREVWQRLGGFDTQFHPLWFEDVDFCKRARDLGLKIQLCAASYGAPSRWPQYCRAGLGMPRGVLVC